MACNISEAMDLSLHHEAKDKAISRIVKKAPMGR